MTIHSINFSVTVDFNGGVITSLKIKAKERLAEPSPLFSVQVCDGEENRLRFSSLDAKLCKETKTGAIYSNFGELAASVEVLIDKKDDELHWGIKATPASDKYFVEWVDFPSVTLPKLVDNNPESGGKILFPYNEGALVSDIDCREESYFNYKDPLYPSLGAYAIFPNMVCSQMLAYIWDDAGLYIGAHDQKRGAKDITFLKSKNGVALRFRLFTGAEFGECFETDYPIVLAATEGEWEAALRPAHRILRLNDKSAGTEFLTSHSKALNKKHLI